MTTNPVLQRALHRFNARLAAAAGVDEDNPSSELDEEAIAAIASGYDVTGRDVVELGAAIGDCLLFSICTGRIALPQGLMSAAISGFLVGLQAADAAREEAQA